MLRGKVDGLGGVLAALDDVEKKAARKGIRRGVTDGAQAVTRAAKANAPVDTKALKKALGYRVKSYRGGAAVVGVVGARRDQPGKPARFRLKVGTRRTKSGEVVDVYADRANYVHLVEFGARPHALGKGSSLTRAGRTASAGTGQSGAMHPGARPRPFLRPAYHANKAGVTAGIVRRVQQEIDKLARHGRGRR